MEIMLPVWPERGATQLVAAALRSIEGVRVAFVDDHLDPELADEVEKTLGEIHGARIQRFIKQHGNSPSPKPMIEEAAQCELAVVGIAMCGSCTAATVADAVALEKKGIHTVTIVWNTFEKAARTAARLQGVADIEFAVIPARQGSDTAEDQRAKARAISGEIVQKLLAS